jgi:heme-degrading monooxygenase HmoA
LPRLFRRYKDVDGGSVMYIRVIRTKLRPGVRQSLSEQVRGKVPQASSHPGVIGHYVVDLGPDQYATVGIFDDKEAADKWADVVRRYVGEHNLGQYLATDEGAVTAFGGNVSAA